MFLFKFCASSHEQNSAMDGYLISNINSIDFESFTPFGGAKDFIFKMGNMKNLRIKILLGFPLTNNFSPPTSLISLCGGRYKCCGIVILMYIMISHLVYKMFGLCRICILPITNLLSPHIEIIEIDSFHFYI